MCRSEMEENLVHEMVMLGALEGRRQDPNGFGGAREKPGRQGGCKMTTFFPLQEA